MNNSVSERLRFFTYLSWICTTLITFRIYYEATFLTWENGPQTIGFALVHNPTYLPIYIFCYLAFLFLVVMTFISVIEIAVDLFKKTPVSMDTLKRQRLF